MRKNSFGAWKSSSAVEKEKKTVSSPITRLNTSQTGTVPPIRTISGWTPKVCASAASATRRPM